MPEPSRSTTTRPAIAGVEMRPLVSHHDSRGELVEMFREGWAGVVAPVQWTAIRSEANVLRGVHCHVRHVDLVVLVEGAATLGVRDLRQTSPSHDTTDVMTLEPNTALIVIPPGVAHGFWFAQPSVLLVGASHVWSPDDDLRCRWDDRQLGIDWPGSDPILSESDRQAGSLADMKAQLNVKMTSQAPGERRRR